MTIRVIVFWMFVGVLASFGLYTLKYRVQALKNEVLAAETQLREEKKNLHVLTAEWTYLNRPERLRQLTAKYLAIKPVHGPQLADFATLPETGVIHAADPDTGTPEHLKPAKDLTLASGVFHAR